MTNKEVNVLDIVMIVENALVKNPLSCQKFKHWFDYTDNKQFVNGNSMNNVKIR